MSTARARVRWCGGLSGLLVVLLAGCEAILGVDFGGVRPAADGDADADADGDADGDGDGDGDGDSDADGDSDGDGDGDADADADGDGDADADGDGDCDIATFSGDAVADTILVEGSNQNFGDGPVANVGVGIGSVGIFQFDLTNLPVGFVVRAVRFIVSPAEVSTACGAGCGDCLPIEADGTLTLFYMRSDWNEAEATWLERDQGAGWSADGANDIDVDRSAAIATVQHQAGLAESFTIEGAALADLQARWRSGDRVSFRLYPSAGAVMVIATRESAADACGIGGYPEPRLEVDFCRQ